MILRNDNEFKPTERNKNKERTFNEKLLTIFKNQPVTIIEIGVTSNSKDEPLRILKEKIIDSS